MSTLIHRQEIANDRDLVDARSRAMAIAAELGFSTPSSFSFAFRRATGGTPASFREQLHRAAARPPRLKAAAL